MSSSKEGSDHDSPYTSGSGSSPAPGSGSYSSRTDFRQMASDLKQRALEVAKHPYELRRTYSPIGFGLKGDSFYITNDRYLRTIFDDVKHLSLLNSGSRSSSNNNSPAKSSPAISPSGTPMDSPVAERKPSSLRVVSRSSSRANLPSAKDIFKQSHPEESPIHIVQTTSPALSSSPAASSPATINSIIVTSPSEEQHVPHHDNESEPTQPRSRSGTIVLRDVDLQEIIYHGDKPQDITRSPSTFAGMDKEETGSLRSLRRTSSDSASSPIMSEREMMLSESRVRRNTDGE